MLIVYGRATSSNVQAVMWCIAELGLEYERKDYGHVFGGVDTPDYLAMNPNGLVPTIVDGSNEPLWESGAIIRYLAAKYGPEEFWPADPDERAQIDKWAEWGKVTFSPAFTVPIFWAVARTPEAERDWAAIRAAVARLEGRLAVAEAVLERRDFLAGPAFSLADIQLGHLLYRYYDLEIERGDLPALAGYYERLCARPAYREHVMVSYAELRPGAA